jgi:hypothetical protein
LNAFNTPLNNKISCKIHNGMPPNQVFFALTSQVFYVKIEMRNFHNMQKQQSSYSLDYFPVVNALGL